MKKFTTIAFFIVFTIYRGDDRKVLATNSSKILDILLSNKVDECKRAWNLREQKKSELLQSFNQLKQLK